MEEIFLTTDDNVKIALNQYKNNYDEVVIVAHGWFMTKDSKAFRHISEEFYKYFDVITLDFRGHGKSSGFYTFTSKEIKLLLIMQKSDIQKFIYRAFRLVVHLYLFIVQNLMTLIK